MITNPISAPPTPTSVSIPVPDSLSVYSHSSYHSSSSSGVPSSGVPSSAVSVSSQSIIDMLENTVDARMNQLVMEVNILREKLGDEATLNAIKLFITIIGNVVSVMMMMMKKEKEKDDNNNDDDDG